MSIANLSYLPVAYGSIAISAAGVDVAAPEVTTTSVIHLSLNTLAGTAPTGAPFVSERTVGTGFKIKAATAGDTSVYNWVVYNRQA